MKKIAKLLVLFLVIALLAGSFAFIAAADADSTSSATPGAVGSYDQAKEAPKGLTADKIKVDPLVEDSPIVPYTITFATWANEDAFKSGSQPMNWYTTDTNAPTEHQALAGLQDGNAGKGATGVGYVHFYSDVVCPANTSALPSAQFATGFSQRLVINLAGHSWTTNVGIRPGDASGGGAVKQYLEIKNGTFVHTYGQMQYRGDTTTVWKNVVYNCKTYANISYGASGELLMFDGCILNIGNQAAVFNIGPNMTDPRTQYVIFKDTDIIQDGDNPKSLFTIVRSRYDNQTLNVSIVFDKDCSIKRNSNDYVTLTDDVNLVNNVNEHKVRYAQGLYFEMGCEFSAKALPSYDLTYYHNQATSTTDGDTVKYSTVKKTLTANTDNEMLEVAFLKPVDGGIKYTIPDDTTPVKVSGVNVPAVRAREPFSTEKFLANENYYQEGEWTTVTAKGGYVKLFPIMDSHWTPNDDYAGITYGVWASEDDFKKGAPPITWYTETSLTGENIGAANSDGNVYQDSTFVPGYVRLYASIENSKAQVVTGQKQHLVIDLNNNILTDTKGFRVGGNYDNHFDAYFEIKNGTVNKCTGQWQTRPATTAVYDGVTFNVDKTNRESLLQDGGAKLIWFKNCFINFSHENAGMTKNTSSACDSVLRFTATHITHNNSKADYALINANNTSAKYQNKIIFDADSSITRNHGKIFCFGTSVSADNAVPFAVEFNIGFEFSQDAIPDYNYFFGSNDGKSGSFIDFDAENSLASWTVYDPATETSVEDWYLVRQGENLAFTDGFDCSLYKIVEYGKRDNVVFNTWTVNVLDTGAKGTAYKHQDGSVFVFYTDVFVADFATFYNYDVTFDLNGFTLTRTSANDFMLGAGDKSSLTSNLSGTFLERTVTIKNGTIVGTKASNTIFQARPGTTLILKDLTFNVNTNVINDGGIVFASLKNCTLNSQIGGTLFSRAVSFYAFRNGTANVDYMFEKVAFNNLSPISASTPVQTTRVVDTVNAKFFGGCTLTSSRTLATLSAEEKVANISIALDTMFTDYKLPDNSVVDASLHTVNVNYYEDINGAPVDVDDYAFMVAGDYFTLAPKPSIPKGKLQTNLTLYTDFTLNFYADKSIVTDIYMNGKALTAENFNGMNKYVIEGISAANAAEAIPFVFVVELNGNVYYVNASYSPLVYANAVVANATVDTLGKQLATAAMEYVKAAYTYSGKTAPAFTGVAINAATAPATTTANLPELIEGAQLSLGQNLKLRFTLAEGKSGTLKVGDATYIVENGKVGAVNYVEVDMRAYAFYNANIVVSDGTTTGTYTLAHYVNAVKGNSNAQLAKLVNAFYTYTKYANEYKTSGVN